MQPNPQSSDEPDNLQEESPKKQGRRGIYNQFFTTAVISISYLICGHAIGWTSPILYKMRHYGEPLNLTTSEASTMVSLFYVGNFVMPIPSGILADLIGRKLSMMILSVTAITSWILAYFAVHVNYLHASRFLIGMWAGAVLTITPMYIGEISEPAHRGAMSALITILVNIGALMAFFITPRVDYWTVAVVFGAFPVIMVILFFFIPESPLWLLGKGKPAKAWRSLSWLRAGRPEGAIRHELELLIGRASKVSVRPLRVMIHSKGTRKAFIIVEVLSLFQRLSGVSAVVGYASMTLPEMSIGAITTMDMIGFIATIWFSSALIHPFLIDRFGRKPLLVISSIGVAVSMLFASIYWFVNRNATLQTYSQEWIAFVLYSAYGVFYNVGLGPVVPTIQGEMFPPDLKGVASGFTAMVVAGTASVITAIYPPISDNWGAYVNFIFYCIVGMGAAVFSWFYVIETKGKSLNEIQTELHSKDSAPIPGPDQG